MREIGALRATDKTFVRSSIARLEIGVEHRSSSFCPLRQLGERRLSACSRRSQRIGYRQPQRLVIPGLGHIAIDLASLIAATVARISACCISRTRNVSAGRSSPGENSAPSIPGMHVSEITGGRRVSQRRTSSSSAPLSASMSGNPWPGAACAAPTGCWPRRRPAMGCLRNRRVTHVMSPRGRLSACNGQDDPVLPVPGCALDFRAMVLCRRCRHDRQSQAGAATIGFGGKRVRILPMFGRDAAAAIADLDTSRRRSAECNRRRRRSLAGDPIAIGRPPATVGAVVKTLRIGPASGR